MTRAVYKFLFNSFLDRTCQNYGFRQKQARIQNLEETRSARQSCISDFELWTTYGAKQDNLQYFVIDIRPNRVPTEWTTHFFELVVILIDRSEVL